MMELPFSWSLMSFYNQSTTETLQKLAVTDKGLSDSQVKVLKEKYGRNFLRISSDR